MAFAIGIAAVVAALAPYAWPAACAVVSARAAARAEPGALEPVMEASARDVSPARPWLAFASRLAARGDAAGAIEAFARVQESAPGHALPIMLLPRLLHDAGHLAEAELASEEARRLSWSLDPWLVLENAWRRLPAPKTDTVTLGLDDYGAARGFLHPYRNYRWTRDRAWLRAQPPWRAGEVEVRLEMGSPEPSPYARPSVTVRACGGASRAFELFREVRPYVWRAACTEGAPVLVEIAARTFNRAGEHDDQGVRVDRLTLRPAGPS